MDDPWLAVGDPVDHPQAAPASDPYAQVAEPAQSSTDESQSAPDGFTDEQKRAILDYIPKAKDAADLEQFSREISGGRSHIGNAQAVLDAHSKGHSEFSWEKPTLEQAAPQKQSAMDQVRNIVGDGLLNGIDAAIPGLGSVLGANREAGKAYTEHVANAMTGDYGPEVGGFMRTLADPGSWKDFKGSLDRNVAHERAILQGDSEGHSISTVAGELTGAGLTAATGNEAGLTNLPKAAKAAATVGEGAVYGSGAAGPGNRAEGAVVGAGLGAATEAAAPIVAKFIAATKVGDTTAAAEAAKAAHDLGIDLPRFVVGGTKDAKRASALEQTVAGAKPISDATNRMLDQSEAARNSIASTVGTTEAPVAMGDQALNAAVGTVKSERARIGNIYDQAKIAASGTTAQPVATRQTINDLIANEREVPGGTKVLPILQHYETAFEDGAPMSIDGARGLRTELRTRLRDEAGVTPDNADRITNLVMGSVNKDITSSLQAAGKDGAVNLYRQADSQWAQQRTVEDDVLKPFLGKNFDNWGEDVAKRINSDVKGNGTRLARFLSALPQDDANTVRASLISHLGSSGNGAQNAAGDAFSLDTFLTNWNQIKGARNLVFSKDTVQSLDKLAKVADVAKSFGRKLNRSNTGGVVAYLTHGAPTVVGTGGAIFTHDPKMLAYGLVLSGMSAVKQYGAAKLLSSPAFARKLAATPMNAAGAKAFWSRPWVNALAVKNPTIAAEIQTFQHAFLANDNSSIVSSAAASPDAEQQNQQQ